MNKLPVFKKKWLYYNVVNNFVSLYEPKTLFRNTKEGINSKISLWLRDLPPIAIYCIKRIPLASSQGLAFLGIFPYAILFSQSLINKDITLTL